VSDSFNVLVLDLDFGGIRRLAKEVFYNIHSVNRGKRVSDHCDLGGLFKHSRRMLPYLADIGSLDKVSWMVRSKSLLLVGKRDQRLPLIERLVPREELFEL
jgi:hypothetical protein